MRLRVTFTVDVDWCDNDLGPVKKGDPLESRIQDAVEQAITHAVKYGEGEGHVHDMDTVISIQMDGNVEAEFIDWSPS